MRLIDADYLKEKIKDESVIDMIDDCPTHSLYSVKPIEVFMNLIAAPNKDALCELIEYLEVWKNHYEGS